MAGSRPIFIRNVWGKGDYEQTLFEIYNIANYLELYVMGSYGRRQLQILNKYDPVGFEGIEYRLYEKEVKKISQGFDIYSDDTHRKHIVSDRALEVIFNDLK